MNAIVLGNIAQEMPGNCTSPVYRTKTLSSQDRRPVVTTDSSGRLWLVIGTESGFERESRIYYRQGNATLTPS